MGRLGRYELAEVLGEGGAGRVYAATLQGPGGLRRPVALKVLRASSGSLRREARFGGLLRHRHLVDVYEVGEVDGTWFCAMERCAGCLAEHVPLPPRAIIEVGLAVCDALQYAHAELGLIHLDLKPANLLVTADGTVKVGDLGIARAPGFDASDEIRGTPGFMAPEQQRGGPLTAAADVFGLARTLLALGRPVVRPSTDSGAWNPTSSGAGLAEPTLVLDEHLSLHEPPPEALGRADAFRPLEHVLEPCLSPDPTQRPSLGDLVLALRALAVDGPGLRTHLGIPTSPGAGRVDTNLEAPRDEFVGRRAPLDTLGAWLARPGVLGVKGPPGVGKSRLAAEAVRRWHASGAGEAWVAPSSEARTVEELVGVVARTLGIRVSDHAPVAHLGRVLASRGTAVFVLDDLALVDGLGDTVRAWAALAPEARFVITSRSSLHAVCDDVLELDVLDEESARALLVERARERGVDISADPDLGALAARLDGLPLALELAAGRLGVLMVRDVLDRLDLDLLRRGTEDRHGTLEAAFTWSWEQLAPATRAALAQLSVFVGGFPIEAAEEVVDPPARGAVLDVLDTLADHSWLTVRSGRLSLLEPVRAFAARHLSPDDPAETRHGAWVATLLHSRISGRLLLAERDNVLAACRRAIARGDAAAALVALNLLVDTSALIGQAATTLALAQQAKGLPLDERQRAHADQLEGLALWQHARPGKALACFEAAAESYRALGREDGLAWALRSLGMIHQEQGRAEQSRACYLEALALLRAAGDQAGQGVTLGNLANLHQQVGRPDEALDCYEAALVIHRAEGSRRSEGIVLGNLGNLKRDLGRLDEAWADTSAALALHREVGNRRFEGLALGHLAAQLQSMGRLDEAAQGYIHALSVHREVGNRRVEGVTLGNLATIHFRQGNLEETQRCLLEAIAIHREVGSRQFEAIAMGNLASLYRNTGRRDEARQLLERVVDVADELESRRLGGWTHLELADMDLDEGHTEHALAHLDAGEPLLRAARDPTNLSRLLAIRASAACRCNDHTAAEAALAEAEALAPPSDPEADRAIRAARAALHTARHGDGGRLTSAGDPGAS